MVAWLERDRAADDAEVRACLKAWIPEYAPPGHVPAAVAAPLPRLARRMR